MRDIIRGWLQTNPARFVSWATAAGIWIAVKGSELIGAPLAADSEVALAAGTLAAFVVTEVIRQLVYSPAAVAEIVAQTPQGGQAATAEAVMDGSPPAVQPEDLPGGAG